jgi:hypothetical protein
MMSGTNRADRTHFSDTETKGKTHDRGIDLRSSNSR